ncbi:MAG: SPOR domain-containing protein [Gemmatimonadetes bacterium]|nr:SPOR domain-containing protein [Gemmatimonadota bacterium]
MQVAAVRSAAAANDLMRRLTQYGYQPRAVREPDGLLKVRVGRYQSRTEAQRVAAALKTRLGGSPFVVEERRP